MYDGTQQPGGLLVSAHFPRDDTMVYGIYKRLDMLAEALGQAFGSLTALFFVNEREDLSEFAIRSHEARLSRRWGGVPVVVRLRQAIDVKSSSQRSLLWRGMVDFRATPSLHHIDIVAAARYLKEELSRRPAAVLAHRLDAMSSLLKLPAESFSTPLFFDLDDVEHISMFRRLLHNPRWPRERLRLLQVPAVMFGEAMAIRRASATFVCSAQDRRHLRTFLLGRNVQVIPNAVRTASLLPSTADSSEILFVGTFSYAPNAVGANFLTNSVWPLIKATVPDARLTLIGQHHEVLDVFRYPQTDVTCTGFVDDIQPYYQRARVVCCPILYGAGTRVKIVEAAAHGRPVVSTTIGAEGLGFRDGREILIRDSATDFAAACVDLLQDKQRAGQIGQHAWEAARTHYDRKSVVARLIKTFRSNDANTPKAPDAQPRPLDSR